MVKRLPKRSKEFFGPPDEYTPAGFFKDQDGAQKTPGWGAGSGYQWVAGLLADGSRL
jgi:hypothetical protein